MSNQSLGPMTRGIVPIAVFLVLGGAVLPAYVLQLAGAVIVLTVEGFIFSTLWNWFVVPIGIIPVSVVQAVGLLLILRLVAAPRVDMRKEWKTLQKQEQEKKPENASRAETSLKEKGFLKSYLGAMAGMPLELLKGISVRLAGPTIILVTAWILHTYFM